MILDSLWSLFFILVLLLFVLDFFIITKWKKISEFKRSCVVTSIIFTAAVFFAAVLFWNYGIEYTILFSTGYIVELALSVDNIFVFILVFKYFKIPQNSQHKFLLIGIISAIALRFLMISFGIALVNRFTWVFYIFGAFLIYSAGKIVFVKEDDDSEQIKDSKLINLMSKFLPITKKLEGEKFLVKKDCKYYLTPLFLSLVFIEKVDLIFALDSIPAILAITDDLFIVFTSNIFAILGLRSMYYVLSGFVDKFTYLKYALAFILAYIGIKMVAAALGFHIPILFSLLLILFSIVVAVSASMLMEKKLNKRG